MVQLQSKDQKLDENLQELGQM